MVGVGSGGCPVRTDPRHRSSSCATTPGPEPRSPRGVPGHQPSSRRSPASWSPSSRPPPRRAQRRSIRGGAGTERRAPVPAATARDASTWACPATMRAARGAGRPAESVSSAGSRSGATERRRGGHQGGPTRAPPSMDLDRGPQGGRRGMARGGPGRVRRRPARAREGAEGPRRSAGLPLLRPRGVQQPSRRPGPVVGEGLQAVPRRARREGRPGQGRRSRRSSRPGCSTPPTRRTRPRGCGPACSAAPRSGRRPLPERHRRAAPRLAGRTWLASTGTRTWASGSARSAPRTTSERQRAGLAEPVPALGGPPHRRRRRGVLLRLDGQLGPRVYWPLDESAEKMAVYRKWLDRPTFISRAP